MPNPKFYNEEFQKEAWRWWRSLSINQQNEFKKKYIGFSFEFNGVMVHSTLEATGPRVAEIYEGEVNNK